MSRNLKFRLSDPRSGWLNVSLNWLGGEVEWATSYVYDSLEQLVTALHGRLMSDGRSVVVWTSEPTEFETVFMRDGESLELRVYRHPGHQRGADTGELLLAVSGDYAEICLPFWRGLRELQGRLAPQEIDLGWQRPFPRKELEGLTEAIKERKPSGNVGSVREAE